MNRKSGSGSGMYIMEMIVAVCFFMICASTCILAFAKADRISRLASERDHAVSAAQSVAEIWKAEGTKGLVERMDAYKIPAGLTTRSGNVTQEGGYRIYWDENWNCVDAWSEEDAPGSNTPDGGRQEGNEPKNSAPDYRYTAELFESTAEDGMKTLWIHVQEGEYYAPALFELEVSRYGEAVWEDGIWQTMRSEEEPGSAAHPSF